MFCRSLFVFIEVYVAWSLVFCVVFCRSLFVFSEVYVARSLVFSEVYVARSLVFCVVLCKSLFVPFSCFLWPLHCLSQSSRNCQSCQTWPAKSGEILPRTDTSFVFCNRKLMRTDILFTRTTKRICSFVNPAVLLWLTVSDFTFGIFKFFFLGFTT